MNRLEETEARCRTAYDAVPYPTALHPFTHPDRLFALGRVHGLNPLPIDRCRVLEIGCGDGGNLLPMAALLPESDFVGIDLSPRQIASGRERVREVGLSNLHLHAVSVGDFSDPVPFDYILVHGVYSWVPCCVQSQILAALAARLSDQGLAYVSYNTFPGWHLNLMVRDMIRHHVRDIENPIEAAHAAFELIRTIAAMPASETDVFAAFIRQFSEGLDESTFFLHYFIHEYLEIDNQPLYFHEFATAASAASLGYVCDSDIADGSLFALPAYARTSLIKNAPDRLEIEQQLDFVYGRSFRRSILCHSAQHVELRGETERYRGLHLSSPAVSAQTDDAPAGVRVFHAPRQERFSTATPTVIHLLTSLIEAWPGSVSFEALSDGVAAVLGEGKSADLAGAVQDLFLAGVLELHARPVACVARAGSHPMLTPLARHYARQGRPVPNQRHRAVTLDDPMARFLAPLLDGTRTLDELVQLGMQAMADGRLQVAYQDQPLHQHPQAAAILNHLLGQTLTRLADLALLAG